jgi:outer membrane protein assembly factor BamA
MYKSLFKTLVCFLIFVAYSNNIKSQKCYIKSIEITGNKRTNSKIIHRELTFKLGETINSSEIENHINRSRNNLINASLFNHVSIYFVVDSTKYLANSELPIEAEVFILLEERLNITGNILLNFEERNFNEWLENKSLEKFTYGGELVLKNFRGRKERLSVGFTTGFNDQLSVKYIVPYIDKKHNYGLGISFNTFYDHNKSYTTEDHKQIWLNQDNSYAIKGHNLNLQITKRTGIHNLFRFYAQYNRTHFSDTLLTLNPEFIVPRIKDLQYLTFSILFKIDHRDYIHYPLEGYYFDCEIIHNTNTVFSKNTLTTLSIKPIFRKYWKLDESLYFAGGITAKMRIDKNESWFFNRALGFGNDYVRGYESYVIDAQNFLVLKSNIKYNIIKQNHINLSFIPLPRYNLIPYRFYLNFFADAGYSTDKYFTANNKLTNSLLAGYGLGLDFVTYYDRAFRFEVSRNKEKEFGFTLQFTAPI